jgi:hypothetical protein
MCGVVTHTAFVVGPVDELPERIRHAGVVPVRDVDLVDPGLGLVEDVEGAGVQELVRREGDGRTGGGEGPVAVDQAQHPVPE